MKDIGFEISGFDTVESLLEKSNRKQIPQSRGVYTILCLDKRNPGFIVWSYGDQYKRKGEIKPLMYDPLILEKDWVPNTSILYIGKASQDLNGRLDSYIRYYCRLTECQKERSHINSVTHRGGRSIWQLENPDNFIVAWMETPNQDPTHKESDLLEKFKSLHDGKRPFANKRD